MLLQLGLLIASAVAINAPAAAEPAKLSGTVIDSQGRPLAGASVRWQAHVDDVTTTGPDGKFALEVTGEPDYQGGYILGVAKKGFINSIVLGVDGTPVRAALTALPPDNPGYAWVPPDHGNAASPIQSQGVGLGCGTCHADYYDAWKDSRHAKAATDPLVLDLYTGSGNEGKTPKKGHGYRLQYPDKAGPCANCHAVTAALGKADKTRLDQVEGVHLSGVYCETCHKVRELGPDPTATPASGAFRYWRPQNGVLMAFGPLDDAADEHHMGPMSYMPEMRQARFCAGCHEWTNEHGLRVMETFSEWAGSPYAREGTPCQSCHMRPFDADVMRPLDPVPSSFKDGDPLCVVRNPQGERKTPDALCEPMGAVLRDQRTIYPHSFRGGDDEHYLQSAAALTVTAERDLDYVDVEVTVENANAGHRLPTGMPFRNMLLVVRGYDCGAIDDEKQCRDAAAAGKLAELTPQGGTLLPEWAGTTADGAELANTPGRAFAKVIADNQGNEDAMFWKASTTVSDNRVPPMGKDISHYRFNAPTTKVVIEARLVYRRVTFPLARNKGWPLQDTTMTVAMADVRPGAASTCAVAANPATPPLELMLVVVGLVLLRRRSRSAAGGGALLVVVVVGLTATVVMSGCFKARPLAEDHVELPNVTLLTDGEPCAGPSACKSGNCAPACDGAHHCAPARCKTDQDCTVGSATGTFCCVAGQCAFAPGGTCGKQDGRAGASCAAAGASACGQDLSCIDACTPKAACAKTCKGAADCKEPVDPVTNEPQQYCAARTATNSYCINDPEVVNRCSADADCRKENAEAVCDITLSRDGTKIATICSDLPQGPMGVGHSCWSSQGANEALCQIGVCWSGGDFRALCAGVCNLDNGDADCKCPAGATKCFDQICVPIAFRISQTDPAATATVPLCYDSNRCTDDDDCHPKRYCATADMTDSLEIICEPRQREGSALAATCTSHGQCASRYCGAGSKCAPRKALGENCTDDAECFDRCVEGICSGPCTDATYCDTKSQGKATRCELKDLSYGKAGATESVKMCLP